MSGWRQTIEAALAALEPAPLDPVPAGWLDRALSLAGLALLALPLSAVVTVVMRWPLPADLLITFGLLAGWAFLTWPYLGRRKARPTQWLCALAFVVGAAGFSLLELWNPYFRGFPSTGGGDGGNHIALQRIMAAGHPEVYQGMAALSATTYWLERLFATDAFVSYRAVTYLTLGTAIGFMAVAAVASGGRPLTFAALLALAFQPATTCLLPLFHYFQGDGFWSQLMGLIPLFTGIGVYAFSRHRGFRLLALGFIVVFTRYTYLLNLGDLLLAAALLTAWEARDTGARTRLILRLGAAVLVLAGIYVYARIYAIAHLFGGFKRDDPVSLALGSLVLAALLLAAPFWFRLAGAALPAAGRRALVMSGALGLVTALAELAYWVCDGTPTYYAYKYPFAGVFVTLTAALVMVAACLTLGSRSRRRVPGLLALVAGAVAGTGLLEHGAAPYRTSYGERVHGAPPWRKLVILADPRVWDEIRGVLVGGRRFGGLLSPRWPESQATNASFGFPLFFLDPHHKGQLIREPRRCVFWYADGWHALRFVSGAGAAVDELSADPRSSCSSFAPQDTPEESRQICHLCFSDQTIEIPLRDSANATFAGFYGNEPGGAASGRWTNGDARVELRALELPREGRCRIEVATIRGGGDVRVGFDGIELARAGALFVIPGAPPAGTEHRIEIRSATNPAPLDGPGKAGQPLGAKVKNLRIYCDLPPF